MTKKMTDRVDHTKHQVDVEAVVTHIRQVRDSQRKKGSPVENEVSRLGTEVGVSILQYLGYCVNNRVDATDAIDNLGEVIGGTVENMIPEEGLESMVWSMVLSFAESRKMRSGESDDAERKIENGEAISLEQFVKPIYRA